MKLLRKSFAMSGGVEGNTLAGVASVAGVVDRGGDVIFPGVWAPVLGAFLTDGFVPLSHDWAGLPVAMPTKAEEVGRELRVEAEFHDTQAGLDAKRVIEQRLAKGLSFGLSVGFSIARDGMAYFDAGEALLEFARKSGADLKLFEVDGIAAHQGPIWAIYKVAELFEFSPCTVPMNPLARATGIKAALGDDAADAAAYRQLPPVGAKRTRALELLALEAML